MNRDESLDPLLRRTAMPPSRGPGTCLDAETLAAFADGSLPSPERALAEAHAADCDRCLALMATMARTAPVSVPEDAKSGGWLPLRWVLPLATVAAVLLLVMAGQRDVSPPAEVARSSARLEPAPPAGRAEVQPLQTPQSAPAPAAPPSQKAAGPTRDAQQQDMSRAPARSLNGAVPTVEDARERRSEAPRALLPSPPGETPAPTAADAPAAAQRTPGDPGRAEAFDQMRRSQAREAFAAPVEISSPNPSVRWRAAGAVVVHSSDGGRTWQEQFTGSGMSLLAGSAPSDRVCWLVGRGGVVIQTTDGQTWRALRPPAGSDLVAVDAADAATATVTAADGRRYRTTTGGRTWVMQEKSPAPF
jgi:hypothetical protein